MGNDVSSQIPLSITPYTKCQNCKKVNDLFLVKNVYHILKRIHNNKKEQNVLDNWAVVATTYMSVNKWLKFFKHVKYKGDYYWFTPK